MNIVEYISGPRKYRVTLVPGTHVIVEMQLCPTPDIGDRVLYYWSSAHSESIGKGEEVRDAPATYALLILGRTRFERCGLHGTFRVSEERTGEHFTQKLRIDVLQLDQAPPLDTGADAAHNPISLLARFFVADAGEELDLLAQGSPLMAQLVEALEEVSKSSLLRVAVRNERAAEMFEARQRQRELEEREAKGKLEGRLEGKLEGKLELAAKLLARGATRSEVEALVGLSLAEHGL